MTLMSAMMEAFYSLVMTAVVVEFGTSFLLFAKTRLAVCIGGLDSRFLCLA
jgi:hypothetical protein